MDNYSSSGGSGSKDVLATRMQRLRRILGFSRQRVAAIRRDHEAFWAVPKPQAPRLTPELGDKVDSFKAKIELAQRLIAAGEKIVIECEKLPPAAALVSTGRYDPEILGHTVRELDGLIAGVQTAARSFQARALELPPPPPPPAADQPARGTSGPMRGTSGPMPGRPAPPTKSVTGPLTRWLQSITEPIVATTMPPGPPPRDLNQEYVSELVAACESVSQVLDEIATELTILRVALAAAGLPAPRKPWAEVPPALSAAIAAESLNPVQISWLTPVTKRLYVDENAVRRAHVAVTQYGEARDLLGQAARQRKLLATVAAHRHAEVRSQLHPGKLRAAALPLSRLHLGFAGVPVLSRLFPDPATA